MKDRLSPGLVIGIVLGIASLIIVVIIAFVIVSTLTTSNLLSSNSTTVASETGGRINATTYTLKGASTSGSPRSFVITKAVNVTSSLTIAPGNYTLLTNGTVSNASAVQWNTVNFTYSYVVDGIEEAASNRLSANFTVGVDNISGKIPTILLVAAIVLILGVLAVLVGIWQRMNLGQGNL